MKASDSAILITSLISEAKQSTIVAGPRLSIFVVNLRFCCPVLAFRFDQRQIQRAKEMFWIRIFSDEDAILTKGSTRQRQF